MGVAVRVPTWSERAYLKDAPHVELSPRRVRAFLKGTALADSEHVLLVYETRRPPLYWFPEADVRMDLLDVAEPPPGGSAGLTRWRARALTGSPDIVGYAYSPAKAGLAALDGHLAFYWKAIDAWFEEDEQIFVHPRDPYTRVDTVHSSRHVRVVVDGETVAESRRPVLLYETGLPTRYYLPRLDCRLDLLEPSSTETSCPYKGTANYYSLRVGDNLYTDFVWYYQRPIPEIPKIEGLLCFYNEKVDIYLDGQLLERPNSPFS